MKKWLMGFVIVRFVAAVIGGITAPFLTGVIVNWWRGKRHPLFRAASTVKRNRLAQAALALLLFAIAYETFGGSVPDLIERAWTFIQFAFHGSVVLVFSNILLIGMAGVLGGMFYLWKRRRSRRIRAAVDSSGAA